MGHAVLTFLGVLPALVMIGILRWSLSGNLAAGNPAPERRKEKRRSHCAGVHCVRLPQKTGH